MKLLVMTALAAYLFMSTIPWIMMLCLSSRFQDRVYTNWGMRSLSGVAVLSRNVIQSMSKWMTVFLIVNATVTGFIVHNALILLVMRLDGSLQGEILHRLTINASGIEIQMVGDHECDLSAIYSYKPALFVGDSATLIQTHRTTTGSCC